MVLRFARTGAAAFRNFSPSCRLLQAQTQLRLCQFERKSEKTSAAFVVVIIIIVVVGDLLGRQENSVWDRSISSAAFWQALDDLWMAVEHRNFVGSDVELLCSVLWAELSPITIISAPEPPILNGTSASLRKVLVQAQQTGKIDSNLIYSVPPFSYCKQEELEGERVCGSSAADSQSSDQTGSVLSSIGRSKNSRSERTITERDGLFFVCAIDEVIAV